MPEIKRSNKKAFETINAKLKALEGVQSKVGWFKTAKYEDGTPVAYVAAIQELGSPANSIPPRPFMRPTVDEKRKHWSEIAAQGARNALTGKTKVESVLEVLGEQAEGDILDAIVQITSPPLSPVTIELRAMKKRNPNLRITGKIVGEAAARVHEMGYKSPSGVSTKPLNDTGHMIATLTHITEKTK